MAAQTNVIGNSRFSANFTETQTVGLISPLSPAVVMTQSANYINAASGAPSTIDLVYSKQLTISGTTVLNLLSGMVTIGGEAAVFARVRDLIVQVADTTLGHYVNVYANASSGWTVGLPLIASELTVAAGGMLHLTDPLSFGTGTGLYVPSGSGSFTIAAAVNGTVVNVIVAGCSVA